MKNALISFACLVSWLEVLDYAESVVIKGFGVILLTKAFKQHLRVWLQRAFGCDSFKEIQVDMLVDSN